MSVVSDGEFEGHNFLANVSSCDEVFDSIKWRDWKIVVSIGVLALINIVVIVGNFLVILAVFITQKLHTVTNLFIVSLAVADLLVGVAVLPFSATLEIFEIWMFGEIWCSMWLAVDVWLCTSSILHCVLLSLDRYVAITRPVTYPSIMSSKKAKILIGAAWILSFLICFPPLVGWNDRKRTFYRAPISNLTAKYDQKHVVLEDNLDNFSDNLVGVEGDGFSSTSSSTLYPQIGVDLGKNLSFGMDSNSGLEDSDEYGRMYLMQECALTCELTNDKGYVVYSALGSFYLPSLVLLFFYWRIYKAAVETTRAINQGFRTTKASTRILGHHFGGGGEQRFEEQRLTLRIHRGRSVMSHQRPTSPRHGPSSSGTGTGAGPVATNGPMRNSGLARSRSNERVKVNLTPPPRGKQGKRSTSYKGRTATYSDNGQRSSGSGPSGSQNSGPNLNRSGQQQQQPVMDSLGLPSGPSDGRRGVRHGSDVSEGTPTSSSNVYTSKMGRRNIKAQVKRFRMETKAAKTLGLVCGVFLLCWFPFFTVYVLQAFCGHCIPPILFSILFWLGYCNSALNPCIYAFFSKDFRFAFKKILCRCICQHPKKPHPTPIPIFLSSLGDDSGENNNEDRHSDS